MGAWWNKKKKKTQSPFDFDEDFLGMSDFGDLFDDLMRDLMQLNPEERKPRVLGFSFKLGPEGKPIIESFGDVKRGPKGTEFLEAREPLINVDYRPKEVIVTAELPGVHKEKINLKTMKDTVVIDVPDAEPKYHSKIALREAIDPRTAKASFKNGVLEIRFKKLKASVDESQIKID